MARTAVDVISRGIRSPEAEAAKLGPRANGGIYSGETDVLPQSSHFKYTTGRESLCPITRALGTPQRGQTIPAEVRFAMKNAPYV
jgi:hypothetical protein